MVCRRLLALVALLALPAVATAAAPARADDQVSPLGKVPAWFIPEGEPMKTVALEMNPLGLAIGLFSANIEYMIAPHHGVIISPHYYFAAPGIDDNVTGGGVEVGYRYYTGLHGPEGWFLGASVLYGNYRYQHRVPVDTTGLDTPDDTSYDAWGGAIDGGYQILLHQHMVIGVGAGVMYRYFDAQPSYEAYEQGLHDLIYGSGFRPRILLTFGGAL